MGGATAAKKKGAVAKTNGDPGATNSEPSEANGTTATAPVPKASPFSLFFPFNFPI
jgi:hypothetical protein